MPVGSEWWGATYGVDLDYFIDENSRQCLSAVSGGVPSQLEQVDAKTFTSPMPVGSEWWGARQALAKTIRKRKAVANACRQ